MNLTLSPEELAFRAECRAWVAENLPADIAEDTKAGRWHSRDSLQRWARILGKRGWFGISWPREYGGPGWSPVQKHLFDEACALAGAPRIVPFGPVMVAPVIMAFGSEDQHRRFLPGIASGEVWWCQGYSEPGAGSDLASLRTRAVRKGNKYLVSGQKTWTSYAQHADWMFSLVRTSGEGRPQDGISFLLIDMKSAGISVRPIRLMDGECDVNEVFFDDVEVPIENRVGEENGGWKCAKHLLGHERTSIANINRSKRGLERLKSIAELEGLYECSQFRNELAKLEIDVIALEVLVLRVITAGSSGQSLDIAGLLKIRGSEIQQRISELAMLAAGPSALARTVVDASNCAQAARNYFSLRKTSIYGGTDEVQRNIIASSVLQ